jgi:hypothetical protein
MQSERCVLLFFFTSVLAIRLACCAVDCTVPYGESPMLLGWACSKPQFARYSEGRSLCRNSHSRRLILLLLLIGGVEQNPGPAPAGEDQALEAPAVQVHVEEHEEEVAGEEHAIDEHAGEEHAIDEHADQELGEEAPPPTPDIPLVADLDVGSEADEEFVEEEEVEEEEEDVEEFFQEDVEDDVEEEDNEHVGEAAAADADAAAAEEPLEFPIAFVPGKTKYGNVKRYVYGYGYRQGER